MYKARAFFYVCAGVFLLALSYHLGARNAGAQQGSAVTGFAITGSPDVFVLTPNGDLFYRRLGSAGTGWFFYSELTPVGNFWSGGPTPARAETWGAVKSRYRGERGAARPTQGR